MNLRAIIHETGWVAVTSHNGPASFTHSQGVMTLKTFINTLMDTPEVRKIEVRPPRNPEEWQWEVSHASYIEGQEHRL